MNLQSGTEIINEPTKTRLKYRTNLPIATRAVTSVNLSNILIPFLPEKDLA
jgi:hypothetical protein